MSLSAQKMNRRNFLKTGAAGTAGLLIGFYFPSRMETAAAATDAPIVLNAWIHVGTDDLVTILIDKSEMGQSILTGLAMIAADELDCDWKKVRTEFAPADKVYFNPRFGAQGTGGSSGTPTSWDPLRKASATARAMSCCTHARPITPVRRVQASTCSHSAIIRPPLAANPIRS